jgi:hypothetical protein
MAKSPKRQPPAHTFLWRLQRALEARGIPEEERTQVKIAKIAEVQQPTVAGWNKPKGFPEVWRGAQIARHWGICIDWLYNEVEPMIPERPEDPLARELWQLWPRLTVEVKGDMLGYARVRARPGPPEVDRPFPATHIPPKLRP